MGFNSTTGSEAGKINKSLKIDLRNDLKTLITHILKDLDYNTLSNTQKLRLLDIAVVGEYYELNGLNYLIVDDSNFNPLGKFLLCTTLVTNMFDSFSYSNNPCDGIDVASWDTSNVTNMEAMFNDNSAFNQDLSMWNVVNVTSYTNFDTDTPQWTLPKPIFY